MRTVGLPVLATAFGMFCTQHVQAQSSVTIQGIADAGVEIANSGKGSVKRVVSGGTFGSRLIFRGSEDLGGGMRAVFRLEQGFNIDDGTLGQGGRMFGREASVGFVLPAIGTVTAGRIPTPYYVVQNAVDAFFWGNVGGMLSLTRSGTTTQQVLPLAVNGRSDNAVNWVSPSWAGLELRAQVAAAEGSATIGRAYGASARYTKGPLDFVAGAMKQRGRDNANGEVLAYVAGGSYNFTAFTAHAGYTVEKNSCATCTGALARGAGVTGSAASEFRLLNLGVRVPIGLFTVIGQVTRVADRSEYTVPPGDRDSMWLAVGGEYFLSKRSTIYGGIATIGNRNGSVYVIGSGSAQQPAGSAAGDHRSTTATLGLRHLF